MHDVKLWDRWLPNHKRVQDEKIVFFLRRHWFVLFYKYLFFILLAAVPILVYYMVTVSFPGAFSSETGRAILIVVASVYYLYLWTAAFTIFIDYYLDIWIVTTHRIVDIEQRGLFNHVQSEQTLERVQDVSSTVKGVFPTFLGYGTVLIQSAAAKNLFHFRQIPDPDAIAREINRLAKEYKLKHIKHEV